MKKFLIIGLIFIFSFTLCGCGSEDNNTLSLEDKMNQVIENGNYIIVDVRTEDEYNEGHVVESINIPYDTIDENVDLDKSKTIMVYCRSGKRSGIAYNTLKELGYEVIDLGAYDTINLEKE